MEVKVQGADNWGRSNSHAAMNKCSENCTHPLTQLRRHSVEWRVDLASEEFSVLMDRDDPLRSLRQQFYYPLMKDLPNTSPSLINPDEESVYLCGNSTGLQPINSKDAIDRQMEVWAKWGSAAAHFSEDSLRQDSSDEPVTADMEDIVGAKAGEVALMNSLTVNLHLLLTSFYRPTHKRFKILLEEHAFPSDHYAVESQIRLHGYNPEKAMIYVKPREGEHVLRHDDIMETLADKGRSIAVVLLPGVGYYTGQLMDMPRIVKAAQQQGCYVGFDLAHAVGNVELSLHDWGVDFAVWCTYKYLNAGMGCIAGGFLHHKHHSNTFPKLQGWWSNKLETRFQMTNKMDEADGIWAYRISCPSPLLCASLQGSLKVFKQTSMKKLRKKSKLLTAYMEYLLKENFSSKSDNLSTGPKIEIITPSNPEERGGQLSVLFSVPVNQIFLQLQKRGVMLDKREPGVLRMTTAPLYNSFGDVYKFIRLLKESMVAASYIP